MVHISARHHVRSPRKTIAVLVAVPAVLLLGMMLVLSPASPNSALVSMDDSGMKGPMYMPEANAGFPRPWDQPSNHPSLSSVQYMPANSTEWYPDQPEDDGAEEGDNDAEAEGAEGAEVAEVANGAEEDQEGEEGAEEAGGDEGAEEEDGGAEGEEAGEVEPAEGADEEGADEEAPAEAEPAEESTEEEPAAERAGVQMLARVKSTVGGRHIADPGEWLQNKVKAGVEGSVRQLLGRRSALAGSTPVHMNHRVIPDPVEWMEERYLKHKHGARVLARMQVGTSARPVHRQRQQLGRRRGGVMGSDHHVTQKMREAHTAQLWQMRKNPKYGNFKLASEGSAKMARQQASLLGCKGTHYRRFGASTTYTIAPCKTQAQEFSGLATNRFTSHADVGTTVDGAFTDFKAIQFQHQWNHQNLADASDNDFLQSSQSVQGAQMDPFGSKADAADDEILQSSAQAIAVHKHPNAMAGMTSARRGPASWHTW